MQRLAKAAAILAVATSLVVVSDVATAGETSLILDDHGRRIGTLETHSDGRTFVHDKEGRRKLEIVPLSNGSTIILDPEGRRQGEVKPWMPSWMKTD